jgi:hypothetical protein
MSQTPTTTAHPWDQRPDEPVEAYARFLTYRNLGLGRTLPLAESSHGRAANRKKTQASGHWTNECSKFNWVARATAWDIEQLQNYGSELVPLWIGIMLDAARKTAQKLADPACVPGTFEEALRVHDRIAPYLTPDRRLDGAITETKVG